MTQWKPAYLVHGEDHGRIAERRAGLRARAEAESGAGGLEVLEGEDATPDAVGRALNAMTFAIGRRFIVVEGGERWEGADVEGDVRRRRGARHPVAAPPAARHDRRVLRARGRARQGAGRADEGGDEGRR